jgi:hypothetical protein
MPTPSAVAISFERVFKDPGDVLTSLVALPDGFLAGGCRVGISAVGLFKCPRALLLRSLDGRSWSEVTLPDAAGRGIKTVARTPFGLIVLGTDVTADRGTVHVAWRSVDGTLWEPFPIPAPESIVFERTISLADRTVFFGGDTTDVFGGGVAWATVDGITWTSGTAPFSPSVAASRAL